MPPQSEGESRDITNEKRNEPVRIFRRSGMRDGKKGDKRGTNHKQGEEGNARGKNRGEGNNGKKGNDIETDGENKRPGKERKNHTEGGGDKGSDNAAIPTPCYVYRSGNEGACTSSWLL